MKRGAPAKPNIDPALRWPGFVGENYEASSRRVLCVAKIHNPTGWTLDGANLGSLQGLMTEWLNGEVTDEAFLREYRTRYATYVQTWGPWCKAFKRVLEDPRIAIPADAIAYTNIAKCWQDGARNETLRLCSGAFPIATLIEIIKPRAIIVLTATSVLRRIGFDRSCEDLNNFSGPHFRVSDADVEQMILWLSERLVRADHIKAYKTIPPPRGFIRELQKHDS